MDAGQVSDLDDGRCAGVGEEGVFGGGGGEGSCLADWGGGGRRWEGMRIGAACRAVDGRGGLESLKLSNEA